MSPHQKRDKKDLSVQTDRPYFIYQDIYELCESLNITVVDFQRYYAYRVTILEIEAPIKIKPLDFLIRVLKKYPHLCPIPPRKSFEEMESVFKEVLDGNEHLPSSPFHQFLGIPKSTYYNMKTCKTPPTKTMNMTFNAILPLLEKGIEGMTSLLKLEKEFDLSRAPETLKKNKSGNKKTPEILTYQDVYDLCETLKVSVYQFQSHYSFNIITRKREEPIHKKSLDFMVRLLREYPALCSIPGKRSFAEMEALFKKNVDLFDFIKENSYYAFLGFSYSAYASRKFVGLEPSTSMNAIFTTVLPLLTQKGTEGALALLKIERESEKCRGRKESI